jgi:hypothetical protein
VQQQMFQMGVVLALALALALDHALLLQTHVLIPVPRGLII